MGKIAGDGTVYPLEGKDRKRCRKWQLRVSLGRDKRTGKYPQATRTFHGTQTEAKAALREFVREIEAGKVTRRSQARKWGEYAWVWLEGEKKRRAYGTWTKYECHIKCLDMHIGHALASEVTWEDMEGVFDALGCGDSPSGRPLSGTYMAGIAATATKVFKSMVKDGLIPTNPMDYVENRPVPDTEEKKALTSEQMDDLIAKLNPAMPTQLVLLLGLKLGLRRGEAHALSWRDVDFDGMVVHVRHSYDKSGTLRDKPKNGKARDIPLTESAASDLYAALDHQLWLFARNRRKAASAEPVCSSDTPVVCNGLGERLLPDASTRWFRQNRARLGCPGWTVHEMRHSYRTRLRKVGVGKDLAMPLLGHTSDAMSALYDHVDMDDKRAAVRHVDW